MPSSRTTPWPFDRSWGDPMLATLALLCLLLGSRVVARHLDPGRPASGASLGARLTEPSLAAPRALGLKEGGLMKPTDWNRAADKAAAPWDRAMVAVLAADHGDPALARKLAAGAPKALGPVLEFAYGAGGPPSPTARAEALAGLSRTYAGALLEARLADREGRDGGSLRRQALDRLRGRLAVLAGLGAGMVLAGLGGLGFALVLFLNRRQPRPPLPAWSLAGRTAALVFLGWNAALLLSGSVAVLLLPLPPPLRILGLPLAYGSHAFLGLWLLGGFSGHPLAALAAPFRAPGWGRAALQAAGFLGVAVVGVFTLGWLLSPLLRGAPPAQRELLEALSAVRGWPAVALLFLTVAVLAPAFEELFFRHYLLAWMAPRWGRGLALLASSLLFGAIHLAPTGLPTLAMLGAVLGWAYLRTGDVRVPFLVHGAWNGAVFLFTRWAVG